MPLSQPPEEYTQDSKPESEKASREPGTSTKEEQDFLAYSTIEPHLILQAELNDLVRDFKVPETKAQLFGSWLQQWNLLGMGVRVSLYKEGQANIASYFWIDGGLL
jgi:hypothetical protein